MSLSLSFAKEGATVKVKKIRIGRKLNKRLCELGIFEGTKITVVRNEFCGPVIVKVLDSKLVLGRGESMKIEVVEQ